MEKLKQKTAEQYRIRRAVLWVGLGEELQIYAINHHYHHHHN